MLSDSGKKLQNIRIPTSVCVCQRTLGLEYCMWLFTWMWSPCFYLLDSDYGTKNLYSDFGPNIQPPTVGLILALASARQHPSYGDCLEVKREYYQNCSVLSCVTLCSQSAAHSYEQLPGITGPADWVCHIGTLTPCIEAVA